MSEKKIVLVEHPTGRFNALTQALKKRNFNVVVLNNGFDALDELQTRGAHALVTSASLPDISGYQLAALIKSNVLTQLLPVVLLQENKGKKKKTKEANESYTDISFWSQAARADLVLEDMFIVMDVKKVIDGITERIEQAKHRGWDPSKRAKIVSSSKIAYGQLLDELLIERLVSRLTQAFTYLAEPRNRFVESYFRLTNELFKSDLLGIVIASEKNPWASFQVPSELSQDSFDSLLKQVNKQLVSSNDLHIDLQGSLKQKKGQSLAEIEILPITGIQQGAAGLVFGSFTKDGFGPASQSFMLQMQLQMKPIVELLLAKQEIETLHTRERYHSATDPLTGLYNLEFFVGFLQQQLLFSFRQKLAVGVIIMDVDNFETINVERGHEVGDVILSGIANRLLNITRASDLVARYGGDEFAIVLPNTDVAGAKVLAEKVRLEIQQMEFEKGAARKGVHVSVSIGCSQFNMEDLNPETILSDAKIALQRAKKAGRNCVRVQAAR